MTPAVLFALQAALVVAGPPLVWHALRLRPVVPLAVFQILCGVVLGPSLLGRVAPGLFGALFPPAGFPALAAVANLAVVLYAFVLGLHIDTAASRGRGGGLLLIGAGSVAVPVLAGAAAGWFIATLFPQAVGAGAVGAGAPAWAFVAGTGICVGVTALPVLAAILKEMGHLHTRFGQLALNCAALNDGALWLMLAVLLALAGHGGVALVLGGSAVYAVLMAVLRSGLAALARRGLPEEMVLVVGCGALFASAAATEALGLHAILGAVVAGVLMPQSWRAPLLQRLETVAGAVLLPFFFTLTGLRTTVDLGSGAFLSILAVTTVAALAGKLAGTAVPARWAGEGWRDGMALGALLGSKGLMEVVALTVLLEAGIITPAMFSAMVGMAVLTTVLAAPVARLAWRWGVRLPVARHAGPPAR